MKYRILSLLACAALAACGGGGSSMTPPSGTGSANHVPAPTNGSLATAVVAFNVPRTATMSSLNRTPMYLSPATDKVSFLVDGVPVVTDAEVVNFNNAGPTNNGIFTFNQTESLQLAFDGSNPAYFAVTVALTLTPGQHKFGVVILSGTPAFVLSEGESTYNFVPGPNANLAPLPLRGVAATGYIECATAAQNLDKSGTCLGYQNFSPKKSGTGGTYTFTAVAGDYNGFPIVYQDLGAAGSPSPLAFDNGSFSVIETDANPIVSLTGTGPFSNPGNDLTGPSGGWVTGSNFIYGQSFTLTCLQPGTATLALQLGANVTPKTPQGSVDGNKYPPNSVANQILPIGINNAQTGPRVNTVTVNCTSTGSISVI